MKVLDLSHIGGEAVGQLLPPTVKFAVPAKDIGQVFGIAFDEGTAGGPPNIYAASTSAYGFNLVGAKPDAAGKPVRLKAGAPAAKFMEGQFGPGATPGAIWKIDGTTGKASLFAETVDGGTANSGPALGDIAIDPKSNSLFASDLDTGLIYRFPLASDGKNPIVFDHGKTGRPAAKLPAVDDDKRRMDIASPAFKPDDPQTWGITPPERRVDGLAVRDGRLHYAVASGLEIWSVGIAADGTFGTDPRRELAVKTDRPAFVSDIVFDAEGRMTLALRGQAKSPFDYRKLIEAELADVLRYLPESPDDPATPSTWAADPQSYAIGSATGKRSTAAGGVALGYPYGTDGAIDLSKCSATLAATGDALPIAGESFANGAQIMSAELVQPPSQPAKASSSISTSCRTTRR